MRRVGRDGKHDPLGRASAVRPGRVVAPSLTRLALRVPDPGLGVAADTAVPDSYGNTCGSLVGWATVSARDGPVCAEIKPAEWVCCPTQAAPAADPCPVCPDGPAADMAAVLVPGAKGLDCAFLVAYAKTIVKGTQQCAEMFPASVEGFCCPTPAAVSTATGATAAVITTSTATGATAAVITTTAATVAAPATTTATVAVTTGVPEGFDVTDQNSG